MPVVFLNNLLRCMQRVLIRIATVAWLKYSKDLPLLTKFTLFLEVSNLRVQYSTYSSAVKLSGIFFDKFI